MQSANEIIEQLVALGASPELISDVALLAANAEAIERRRANDRERKRRHLGQPIHVNSRDVTFFPGIPPTRGRGRAISNNNNNNTTGRASPKDRARSELLVSLDEKHAEAVIDHRQKIGSPLTERAAKMLSKEFAKCSNPNGAADEMLARGWRGFKQEWLETKTNGRGEAWM